MGHVLIVDLQARMKMKKYDIVNWCGVGQRLEELGFERVDGSINYKAPEDSVMSKFDFFANPSLLTQ